MPASIVHHSEAPYAYPVTPTSMKLRLKVRRGGAREVVVLYRDRYVTPGTEQASSMEYAGSDRYHDYYEMTIDVPTRRLAYLFHVTFHDGTAVWYGERGAADNRQEAATFQYPYICGADLPVVPDWVKDAVVYQIFPDRFSNGDTSNDQPHTEAWTAEARPTADSFFGGDLRGIINKLPYLKELGVNLIYTTPIFLSHSNHKYDTVDYYQLDPSFGDEETMKELVKEAHKLGIRVMLDAVFNHTGDGFFAFQHLLKNGEQSPYKDWYFVESYPVTQDPVTYETFGNHYASMPKLNTGHEPAGDYMIEVAKYWVSETGIDGWRFDVANEVDAKFWRKLRTELKSLDAELLLLGEFMHDAGPWLRGDQFDGVMNYMFRESMLDYFAKQTIDAKTFGEQLTRMLMNLTDQAGAAMLQLIDSHDTERFLTTCMKGGIGWDAKGTAEARMRLAVSFQLAFPGMPMIYYGDEAGMQGEHDPDCRRPMLWEEADRSQSMYDTYARMIALRHAHPALRRGTFRVWFADAARNAFGFVRETEEETIYVIINNSAGELGLKDELNTLLASVSLKDVLNGRTYDEGAASGFSLPAYGCAVLLAYATDGQQ
ncbi:glycoside hydrolase family 13 protein [Paenibacillus sp. GCM10023252]|uniref:glycoside hydrolase family 13 protein n=1 Tax=Paenibacillus sp. GCM10023252 TaxID=3252649 RepID=UPI0036133B76